VRISLVLLAAWFVLGTHAASEFRLARDGKAECVIVRQPGLVPAETNALEELRQMLKEITGAEFPVQEVGAGDPVPAQAIVVGPGPVAEAAFPGVAWDALGAEGIVLRSQGGRLLLAGGRPRGTRYAVSQFLQEECGVRWWTPWAKDVPRRPTLEVRSLDVRYQPPFESRDPFWYPAFNAEWAVRNFSNSQSARIPPELGGCIGYKGFVHTFYPLVPPEEHFDRHPEWYSLIDGKRTHQHGQLCLTNPELRKHVVERVRQWLRESPEARIVSVSQNDWHGACQCDACRAFDDAEGSRAGTMVDFVNFVAEQIEPEFPQVAVDTLAYQYTRKPPRNVRPRPNVIIRLCSIECNFREPLEHPSNASFADDIRGWSKICNRLYIWDYTTDFAHYVQPHPNWFVLGPNIRFFEAHHVKGVFEQGAYQSFGSEFGELRAWVLAQLLWKPSCDDRVLIDTFLNGYYGKGAASHLRAYLDLMQTASHGVNLTCFSKTDVPFLRFGTLVRAEQLWQHAEEAAAGNPELLARVRLARLPVRYAWLMRWEKLREECVSTGGIWPLPASRKAVADEWLKVAQGEPGRDWTRVKLINESGLTPEKFIERFAQDPPEPKAALSPRAAEAVRVVQTRLNQALPRVQVSADGRGFTTADNRPFVPWGVNYFRPGTGWAPRVWKEFDAEATRRDFARLKQLGANCVRVFLTFGSFYSEPGRLDPEGLAKFDQFLEMAEQAGLYVHPTGPDHWEGLPEWARGDRYADESVLAALEQFWRLFATRYRGRNGVFAYDLLNEPEIRWDTAPMREKWRAWTQRKYGSGEAAARAWGITGPAPELASLAPPARDAAPGAPLLDYQRFREEVAEEWVRRQVMAIRGADPGALVTVGLIQWSVPVLLAGPFQYSAFRPERLAPWLDFLEVHFYPLAGGFYEYGGPEAERQNLAYLEAVVRETARPGKPVVLAEFGWYGGGQLTSDGGRHPAATEEHQAHWCRRAVETTLGLACGWLNWGFHDHPQARDVTEYTGLLTAEGKVKAWGRVFEELGRSVKDGSAVVAGRADRPVLDWDRAIADRRVVDEFRRRYTEAFEAAPPRVAGLP